MKLRRATNKDSVIIINLITEILEEYGLKTDPQTTDIDIFNIESYYTNRNGFFWIMENNSGNPVATLGLYNIDETTCELRKMYLVKTERGKGYGKLLMDHALMKAKECGYKKIILETASILTEAISLYKNYGFREYSPGHFSNRCDQAFFLNI